MRVPVSWLRDYVDLPADLPVAELANRLTLLGLKLEALESPGADLEGPLVVGRVLTSIAEQHPNGKTISWCGVDVGEDEPRGIVCGASNFGTGDLVAVALPGAVLPGGFEISARTTYGHVSDGMICSAREVGLGDEHSGILVLPRDVAEPGEDAAPLLGVRDDVIEFEINPDRAYALSIRGVAREAALAYGLSFADPGLTFPAAGLGDGYAVSVEDPADCDVFVALEVTGFDATAPTPPRVARRVQLAGMRPISLAVDVTNYVMLELGLPIHGYDKSALTGAIAVRRARTGETLQTLDGVRRKLDPEDLLITDDTGPIGLAGVMGGAATELSASTTDVVIEAASFDPVLIARGARRHKLPSEASKRFERGVDATLGAVAAQRVADLLVEYGGGRVAATGTRVGSPAAPAPVTMTPGLPDAVAGFDIGAPAAVRALRAVGCDVRDSGAEITATPPPWRHDLTDPYDLVEEVVRVVGYDKVPSVLPAAPAGRGLTKNQRLRRRVGRAVASAGYVEALSYPFIGEKDLSSLGLDVDDERRNTLRVANPLSDEEPLLRTTLLPGLLRVLARNAGRGQGDVGVYELASVFLPDPGERVQPPQLGVDRAPTAEELKALEATLPAQPLHLGVVVAGQRAPGGWWGTSRDSCWADAVEICRQVARAIGVAIEVLPGRQAPWHPGRCAQIVLADAVIGHAGELHPRVCQEYGVPARAAAAELDLDALLASAPSSMTAPALSTYPVGKEDVALVVDAGVTAAEVEKALRAGAGELLESLRLFDVYVGEQVGDGKKSMAFSLRFRAPDRTLTDAEIKAARDAAVRVAAEHLDAVLRSG